MINFLLFFHNQDKNHPELSPFQSLEENKFCFFTKFKQFDSKVAVKSNNARATQSLLSQTFESFV